MRPAGRGRVAAALDGSSAAVEGCGQLKKRMAILLFLEPDPEDEELRSAVRFSFLSFYRSPFACELEEKNNGI